MKKHNLLLLVSLLFWVATAMTCDDEDYESIAIQCVAKDITLHHWNNAGEFPVEAIEAKIPKEAYILDVCVWAEIADDESNSNRDNFYAFNVLSDNIKKVSIFTDIDFNEKYPAGAEVTSCFSDYPKAMAGYQKTDDTAHGEDILYERIHKALLTTPQPGEYRFRVVLTLESGETIEQVSEPVTLY
ncbi:DUF5034 domain-containing protein [Bacteroides sp. GM023]|uniref:DUF5034 domain-containing protein n=1 Tax=Bacteroides sp. GM023 TaxID=2723058 RepID=UPI001CC2F2F8|nr:DUF5034 domain-containing protein [Bacteroides sp. GM023]MBD3590692.1 DUF5034 domain-containing protein [Bacteroides sp. GM023]